MFSARSRCACPKMNCDRSRARILAIASSERPALMVGFNRRFAPMSRADESLSSRRFPSRWRCTTASMPDIFRPDHWVNDREQGGGRILGEVCHFVDLLMFLAGSPIVEVEARAVGTSARYSGDNVLVSLAFREWIAGNDQLSGER